MRGLAAGCAGSRHLFFISHHAVPQPSTARCGKPIVRAARPPARQRSTQLFAPEPIRLMKLLAPVSSRSGWAALWASVAGLGRQPSSLHPVLTGSRLSAPINPRDILASPGRGWSHNSSSKPTPCLGFVETSRRASNTGPSLLRSARLNSGVMRGLAAGCAGSP